MTARTIRSAFIVLGLILVPAFLSAQTRVGSVAGVVKDATGAVLPGVAVEASRTMAR